MTRRPLRRGPDAVPQRPRFPALLLGGPGVRLSRPDPVTAVARTFFVVALLVLAGCVGVKPRTVSAPASATSLDCALGEVARRGYTVEAAAPGVFFKAERAKNVLAFSVLNVSVAQGTLRVTGATEVREEDGRRPQSPSKSTMREAEDVAATCAAGAPPARR